MSQLVSSTFPHYRLVQLTWYKHIVLFDPEKQDQCQQPQWAELGWRNKLLLGFQTDLHLNNFFVNLSGFFALWWLIDRLTIISGNWLFIHQTVDSAFHSISTSVLPSSCLWGIIWTVNVSQTPTLTRSQLQQNKCIFKKKRFIWSPCCFYFS